MEKKEYEKLFVIDYNREFLVFDVSFEVDMVCLGRFVDGHCSAEEMIRHFMKRKKISYLI